MHRGSLRTSSILTWSAWVALNTIGVVSAYVLSLMLAPAGEFARLQVSDRTIATVGVLLVGLLLGTAQWLLVRLYLPRPALWIPATFVGWVLPIALLVVFFPSSVGTQQTQIRVVLASIGLLMGVVQYLLLRPYKPHSAWWIPASVVGWIILAVSLPIPITHQVEILKVGAIPALITGIPFALVVCAKSAVETDGRRMHAA